MGNAGSVINFSEYILREIQKTVTNKSIHTIDELPSTSPNQSKTLDVLQHRKYFLLTIAIIQEIFRDCASNIQLDYIFPNSSTKVHSSKNNGNIRIYYCLSSDRTETCGIWFQSRRFFHLKPGDYVSDYTSTPRMLYNHSEAYMLLLSVELDPNDYRNARPQYIDSNSNHGVFTRG